MLRWITILTITFLVLISGRAFSEDIRYCEKAVDKNGKQRYPDENAYHRELTIQAQRLAVRTLFKKELEQFQSGLMDEEMLVDALTNFIEHETDIVHEKGKRDSCVVLKNLHKKDVGNLFKQVEIGRVCSFDDDLSTLQIDEMRQTFINDLRKKETISQSVLSMMENPDNINMKTDEQLHQYIYEQRPESEPAAIKDVQCRSLTVFPIELYAASSRRKISSVISVMPAIETLDENKKKGEFQLIVIEKEYHWIKASEQQIAGIGNIKNFTAPFLNTTFQDFMNQNFRDLICIGMASCEGKTEEEDRRGKIRALNLKERLAEAFKDTSEIKVYGLNLGKHKFTDEECDQVSDEIRNSQRIVMLVGVTKRSDPEVDLRQALENAMKRMADSQKELLPIDPADYRMFDFIE